MCVSIKGELQSKTIFKGVAWVWQSEKQSELIFKSTTIIFLYVKFIFLIFIVCTDIYVSIEKEACETLSAVICKKNK
jgi:hypothetical protein